MIMYMEDNELDFFKYYFYESSVNGKTTNMK